MSRVVESRLRNRVATICHASKDQMRLLDDSGDIYGGLLRIKACLDKSDNRTST